MATTTQEKMLVQRKAVRLRTSFLAKARKHGVWYLLILPNLLNFLVFSVFSWVFLLGISFTNWSLISAKKWVGVKNYATIFTDEVFLKAMVNTAKYVLMYVFPLACLSLIMALVVNQKLRGVYFFRACYYLPVVTTMAVIAMVWVYLVKPTPEGVFNYALGLLGIPHKEWLLDPDLALPTLAVMSIWKQLGYYMLLWVAGLLAIPQSLYEAARIDGASRSQLFWHITMPMLRPTTTFIIIVATIRAFQMFGPTYMMTGGGPMYSTTTLVYHLWLQAFEFYRMGRSAAISMVLFAIILTMTLVQKKFLKWEEEIY